VPRLIQVATHPAEFTPEPITDREAEALLRASLNLFKRWNLSDGEAAILLDAAPRTFARWKAGSPGRIDRDQRARMSNLMGIHKALRLIFKEAERAYEWVRKPNATFGGKSALAVMLNGELTDLMRVRRYLDAERGGW
jgi:uncharacterized protein (DUF2384 family)